ncbi:endonuclease [Corynebacterium coyleae]|uniref:endonuclease n=1 Tax=Corynebacterium coyleae TaxID=53374 RepID=UPI001CCCC1DB|nr:endonuclease [Corynebacterium coyleae]UBI09494.1 endonuclease [Corynebacterium coyleae]
MSTFAEDAGISLDDDPTSLFQLLVLCMLQAKPIRATVAVDAARGLFDAGLTSPSALVEAPRSQLIRIFGAAGYARYDESTATRLHAMAHLLCDDYSGDLRNLRPGAPSSLEVFDGVGPACATMFAREAQGVWPELAPVFDKKALQGAAKVGLPEDAQELESHARSEGVALPAFAAHLVKVALGVE